MRVLWKVLKGKGMGMGIVPYLGFRGWRPGVGGDVGWGGWGGVRCGGALVSL